MKSNRQVINLKKRVGGGVWGGCATVSFLSGLLLPFEVTAPCFL